MDLQSIQTGLCSLIKSKPDATLLQDDYLRFVAESHHLALVKKIALWWRKIQIEGYCHLTSRLLKSHDKLDHYLVGFFSEKNYSPFRDEVGKQFLEYLAESGTDKMLRLVAAFELALIRVKTGEQVAYTGYWPYEPYTIINGLLAGPLSEKHFQQGNYKVEVFSAFRDELFRISDVSYSPLS